MTRIRIPALLATLALLIGACGGGPTAAPTAAPTTEADIEITGPVTLTLWHALTSDPQKAALEAAVKKFNETNGKGITVTPVVQGNYTQLYQKTLGAIQAGALPEIVHAYESQVADYQKAAVERARQGQPGRHLQAVLRHEPIPSVQQRAALLPLHEVAVRDVHE